LVKPICFTSNASGNRQFNGTLLSFTLCGSTLHRAVMRMGFQMIFSAWTTEEVNDFLFGFAFFRHGVWTSGKALAAPAFWTDDAEASASSVASASSYSASEDVRILAIVVAELEFRKVERQILRADVMIRPDDSALEQTPKVLDVVRMDLAANVLFRSMVNGFMAANVVGHSLAIASTHIGRNQINSLRNSLIDETIESLNRSILDDLADDVTLAGDRADDTSLAGIGRATAVVLRTRAWRFFCLPPM
jgi:hypothetical protein